MSKFNGYSEAYATGTAMARYGGGFFGHLGKALQNADENNARKIQEAWPEEYARYREWATQLPEFQDQRNR